MFLYLNNTHLTGEGNSNPLQYSCLENPVDRGAWWAAVHRVAQSWTRLKRLSMHACIGGENGNPLQYSCLENPRDRGAWWAAVFGVAQSRTRLRQLSRATAIDPMPLPTSLRWDDIPIEACNIQRRDDMFSEASLTLVKVSLPCHSNVGMCVSGNLWEAVKKGKTL